MQTYTDFGSMRVTSKRPRHVHGDSDDGTITRFQKALAMAEGIDLYSPLHTQARDSMRRHRRVAMVVLWAGVLFILGLTARMLWKMM
jgi:hypothetical protein